MNLQPLSRAFDQISYIIRHLSKKNFKSSTALINMFISNYGFEIERHVYHTLVSYLDLQLSEKNDSSAKRAENVHINYWLQEIPSLIAKSNFVTLICYAFDTAIAQQSFQLPSPSTECLTSLCKLFKLSLAQGLVFAFALRNSMHGGLQSSAYEHILQNLPELIQLASGDNGMIETGLASLPVEVLHSLLLSIQQFISTNLMAVLIKAETYEKFLDRLRREYPKERMGNNGSVILLPLLYSITSPSTEPTSNQLLFDSAHLSTNVWQMDGSLADVILEMGYGFTASIEDCRNALIHFGLQELKSSTIARILAAMIQTHSGLSENTHIYDSNGIDMAADTEKNSQETWNVDTFVLAINDLIPTVTWKDVVKELDHPGFSVPDRHALVLLVTALHRALPVELYIEFVYGRWTNVEGQLSWLNQAIRHPDVFCFGDYPVHSVLIDCLKHPLDDTKEIWTWRSLNLIECLLRIADGGLNASVLELFKHGMQRASELIFLGLLQLPTVWTTLKQELLQLIVPSLLVSSPNVNLLLNCMWNSQNHTTLLRSMLLTSLADWYNRAQDNEQQQRLSRVLEVVQDLKTLPTLLGAQPMIFILDLACLASRRGYLKLDKWLLDKLREHQESFAQTIVQYLRKKVPQLLHAVPLSKDDPNLKPIPNIETINVLLSVLQLRLSSITNSDLAQEIQTMLSTAKILNTLSTAGAHFPSTNATEQSLSRPGSIPLPLNISSQQLYHSTTAFTPSPTSPSSGMPVTNQLRSLTGSNGNDASAIGPPSSSTAAGTSTMTTNLKPSLMRTSDVDFYFKRLYSKTNNPPPLSVDEFIAIMARCKDSQHQREKDVFIHGIRSLFEEYKFYTQYPERELHLTAQLFGGLFERGLFPSQATLAAYRVIQEGLKKPTGTNLWNFAITALDRCKARIREQPEYLQSLRNLPTYTEIPLSIREYLEHGTRANIQQPFDPLRTLTPTSSLSTPPTISPQPQSATANMFPRVNSSSLIANPQQIAPGNINMAVGGGVGRENPSQKGPSLTQNANIRTLTSDPSYHLVRIKPPPEQINDKIAFTFNNLSFANLSQKAEELKEVLGNDEQLWQWVAQYLVMKRASIEPNFHSLYAGFINTINVNILFDTVLSETHRNIKILLLSDKQMNNIPDRALLKNLGHWLGIITIAKNKPILATDLELKSLLIEAYHMGSQELLYVIPFVAKILESCTRSKIFQQPNPWLLGIMSVLAEMHSSPDFKLNMKFEIEVLCRQLQIQLSDLSIHNILSNKEYFDKIEKQLSNPNRQPAVVASMSYQPQSAGNLTTSSASLYNDPAILNYHQLSTSQQPSNTTASISTASTSASVPMLPLSIQPQASLTPTSSSVGSLVPPAPKYKLSDFKPSIFQSLSSMLEINPNILLFQHHPRLKTYIHPPIEQAINESLQTVQRSLKVATSAAETIVRKDFLLNPDEQQLRTSARNMVAYLSSGLVLITARPALQDLIQSCIKTHLQTVLGVSQAPGANATSTNNTDSSSSTNSTTASSSTAVTAGGTAAVNGTANDQLSNQTREMINQAASEIAASNIELCCCLLQRITIHRAIQLIDQRLAADIETRQRCRLEGRQLSTANAPEFQSERLLESIRLRYGPLSSHQLAIYEDFVHFIPGFKPSENEKRDLATMEESNPPVWDRLVAEVDQIITTQHNPAFANALQRLLEAVNILRTNLHSQPSATGTQAALNNILNIIIYNLLEHYTLQAHTQDGENLERFKNVHMSVLKLLVEIRLHMSLINKQLTKAWLECPNELKFNVFAVNQLLRNRLLDIRQMDAHVAQLIDSGSNLALNFAVSFLRNCVIEQPCCVDSDIASILDSLHRISLIGKQPAEAVRDLLEIIRLNYTSLTSNNEANSTSDANMNAQSAAKIDKLAIISLSVINSGHKYLTSNDESETAAIATKAKHILTEWVTLTMTQTNRVSQQQSFQGVFNQMNIQGLFRSDDTIAKFLRITIQLCVNSVYDIIRQAPPITSSSATTSQQAHYNRCHQGIDSLCRFLSLLTTHTSDMNNYGARIHLINRILGILAAHCYADHEEQGDQFHPLAYQRIILNLFQESTAAITSSMSSSTPSPDVATANEYVMYYIYLAFTNCLHLLRPQRVPGFAFAWLEIVAHRTFMSRLLLSTGRFVRQAHNMYALLLVDALRLVTPFIRSGEHAQSFQVYFKGILKTFMLLLHDFPEFLCEHYYQFCDALPLIAHQLRNIVLSAFPKHMRCPDPFLVNFKVDMLNDISIVPVIAYNFSQNIQPPKFKQNLDSYLRTRAPVTFLSELRSYLQQGADPGSHYNIRMLNALVLYVATQALSTLNNKTNGQPLMSSITHSAHMDIFQNLAVDLDTEGRYIFLNAMANHLRYPNTHTHYFSYTLLYLFAEANSEALQEQIVRVLLERLVANRPHPWGLLITFLELVRNPNLKLWTREFMSISPDVKRLLTTLTRGFPHMSNTPIGPQSQPQQQPQQQQQQQQQQTAIVKP